MTEVTPYPKAVQLARNERRYYRKVASPKQWQQIIEAKRGPCRICDLPQQTTPGREWRCIEFHHVVPRSRGGDDSADNIVPLCRECHVTVTLGDPVALEYLMAALTSDEYAYAVKRGAA